MSECETQTMPTLDSQPMNGGNAAGVVAIQLDLDGDDFTTSSILEFLNQEKQCLDTDNGTEIDVDSIFEEINRLSDDMNGRNVEDILREAEMLINKQELGQLERSTTTVVTKKRAKPARTRDTKCSTICPDATDTKLANRRPSENSERTRGFEYYATDSSTLSDCSEIERHTPSNFGGHSPPAESKRQPQQPIRSIGDVPPQQPIPNNTPPQSSSSASPTAALATSTIDDDTASLHTTKKFIDKFTSPSPSHTMSASFSFSRERTLEHDIELLQEKLKDTEERLQSVRLQHDSLSLEHRTVRENLSQYHDTSERLRIDVQHLNECANVLRTELKSTRADRSDALELHKVLQRELNESRADKKKVLDQSESDTKTIQDLQRQCKEMERILMRKYPDSVSALIVASKNPANRLEDSSCSRRLLEQRIAQLESDAREQDVKAQQILANVQSRFSSVQSKYEQHIADLETQVISLQQINARLNEKITCLIEQQEQRRLQKSTAVADSTQTHDIAEHEMSATSQPPSRRLCAAVSTQTDFKHIPFAKNAGPIKKSKSASDSSHTSNSSSSTSSSTNSNSKDDAHLLATIRGMRVDLAIKEKAMQRLTRELEEWKKTAKKTQKEKDALRLVERSSSHAPKKTYDPSVFADRSSEAAASSKDYVSKIQLLEYDYSALHSKRLQDLKTLQAAHERELSSCHETVRILQQRLTERDEAFAMQTRRKVPVDYFALKAKVSTLERRHTEREERLHILVDALSKGRLNDALESIQLHNVIG